MNEEKLAGNCFWGHTWSVWEEYLQPQIVLKTKTRFSEPMQKRRCVKCNRVQTAQI